MSHDDEKWQQVRRILDGMDPVFSSTPRPAPQTPIAPESSHRQQDRQRLAIIGIVAAVIVALLGGGAYWWVRHQRSAQVADNPATDITSSKPDITPDISTDTSTNEYVSNGKDLNLSFTYPTSWSVAPPTNTNTGDEAIAVTSPLISIADANNRSVTGRVVVSIRPGGSTIPELAGDHATAGQASAQVGYDKPTAAQHQYPYLTYIHLAGGSNPGGAFEEVMITGVTAFAKDQAIMSISLTQLDPIISARFYACNNQSCPVTDAAPLSITNATWVSDAACLQTLAIFKSLQIN